MMSVDRRDFLTLAAAGALGGCGGQPLLACPEPRAPGIWNNAVDSITDVRPELLAYPSSATTVIELVKAAESQKQRVRMTGSGHSFSDVAVTDEVLLLPNRLSLPLELDRGTLKAVYAGDSHLVRVQGGMTVRALNTWLDAKGLALTNLGGYDGQTITGVAMTATHGSGLGYGPIAAQIASLELVTTGGAVRQIEPSDGITDPAKFTGRLKEDATVPVTLVQDDDEFNAVSVSMGSMGVVTAVVLRTVDKFWLREERTLHRWSDLAKPGGYVDTLVHRPGGAGYPDHVEIYVNPYADEEGEHLCLLTRRYRSSQAPAPTEDSKLRGAFGDLAFDPQARELAQDFLRRTLNNAKRDDLEGLLSGSLGALADANYTAPSYKVFNLGGLNLFRVYGIELAFPVTDTLRVAQAVFEQAKREYAAGRHHSAPFSLRFVKASSSYLAMQHGRDTAMLEIGVLVEAHGSGTLLRDYEQLFIEKFAARPHWGLDMSYLQSWSEIERLYGQSAQDWQRVYRRLNSAGTFDGHLTDRLGISMRPKG
ncbi:MAG TPA: FAD-binding protein [Polyangiaceae bacterium]|nr:FAD-binding protein [Polyangiaceae bacterium]